MRLLVLLSTQQRRHVAGRMLLIQVVATLLLCSTATATATTTTSTTPAAGSNAPPTTRATHQSAAPSSAISSPSPTSPTSPANATARLAATIATTQGSNATAAADAAATGAAAVAGREVIGATSLAAAAGAAAAMADSVAMARSGSATSIYSKSGSNNPHSTSDSSSTSSSELLAKSANLLFEQLQQPTGHIVNLTRQHDGDVFRTNGVTTCNADTCVGLSSGTAGLVHLGGGDKSDSYQRGIAIGSLAGGGGGVGVGADEPRQLDLLGRRNKPAALFGRGVAASGESCQCRCLPYLSTYREDLGICVDDIHECTLSPFVSGSSSEKIPFVFLPLRGQIIYPSREISFPDVRTPVCAVTGAQYLTTNGWSDLRNPIDTDYPFRMFRDEGRTFLQWLGEPDLRQKMQGRLIVVHLVCRDMTITLNATAKEHFLPPKNVFSPCVAFRVNGTPVKYTHNVSEVLFQSEATATLAVASDGMSTKEYVVIGVCSLLLGLIYVSSVFLYLHMKKRKSRDPSHMRNSLDDIANEINYPKNDQVTFGAPFHRSGSIYSATSLGTSNEPRSRTSIGSLKEEMGIVKNNPLLQHFPQLSDHHSGFASDVSNSNSECEMDGSFHDKLKQMQTAALVHPPLGMGSAKGSPGSSPKSTNGNASGGDDPIEPSASPTQENECLPVENVSIVEDMMTEEKLEHLRAMANGNVRKKLYFNPAYFEPHLLAEPPPAAVEFLEKIREVIAIAKYKMATKRYQPSLIVIPEEGPLRSNTPSLYGSQMQTTPTECPGCVNHRCSGHVKNCGDKRNSIEKWLQTVTSTEQQKTVGNNGNGNGNGNGQKSENADASGGADERQERNNTRQRSPPKQTDSHSCANRADSRCSRQPGRKEVTPPKQRPPPPPTPTPTGATNDKGRAETQTPSRSHVIPVTSNSASASASASYQHYCTNITTGPSVTIPISCNYESFSALSAAANIYGFAETGSEIYNNPKFTLHDSPAASQRSHSSSHRSKSSRKRLDVLDQYAAASTPTSLTSADRQHYEMLRNMKQPPDMVYDTANRGYASSLTPRSGSSFQLDIPTPDYDSTMEKKIKDIYNSTQSSMPSVPTPDYSTLSRKSLKQFQPDSPIYRRKSPQYLIVDYETDSLERLEATKHKSSQSSSSPSSDVSSQLSPSLSTALPLEEELEISHTVFGKGDGFRKEDEVKKKPVTKKDSNPGKQKEIAARIKYDTPFRGSMTIEVEHEPQSDMERSTDSDQFEPDTLDRKPKKQSFCDVNAWPGQLKKVQNKDNGASLSHTSLPNMGAAESPPPAVRSSVTQPPFVLRSSSSFHSQNERCPTYESRVELRAHHKPEDAVEHRSTFSSLREIYQSPLQRENSRHSCKCGGQVGSQYETPIMEPLTEQGRLLTLEAKQKRRQQVINAPAPPPPIVEISKVPPNKTTIKITTPKVRRAVSCDDKWQTEAAFVTPHVHSAHRCTSPTPSKSGALSCQPTYIASSSSHSHSSPSKAVYDLPKNAVAPNSPNRKNAHTPASTLNSTASSKTSSASAHKKRIGRSPPPLPPPPPPPTSASNTLTSHRSHASSQHSQPPHYQNQPHYMQHSTTNTTEEETASNHSESTEITGVSDNVANSEFGGSCDNTLSSVAHTTDKNKVDPGQSADIIGDKVYEKDQGFNSPQLSKKLQRDDADYGAMFNTHINGLRNDYSLTKYLNRRKSQDHGEEEQSSCNDTDSQLETNNNLNARNGELDANKLDVLSISSRSNRSSSRLSDRTKEMYRNAGVPVGIAYPQRSSAGNNSASAPPPPPPTAAANVQTVYRCEIEPVQLTHGMQIAMGLKDRAKKAKDLKNAWKKFVSMAAAKFSPTHSPAPPYDKKTPSFLEVLDRDEGISSLIEEHPRVSTPKSSYSAPASQNYYEQRFGPRGEMDSGYMSADSGEVYKRSFYDRYNFKMMSGRDHIIRVDTIEDNSDGGSTLTDRHNGVAASARRSSILDSNRFEDFEHMGEPPENELTLSREEDNLSEADSDKTLTHTDERHGQRTTGTLNLYSSEDERGEHSPSYGSSETDGETNAEDMWESGAESIETHSVLYKNVRKN